MSNHNNLCRDGIHNGIRIKGRTVIDSNRNAVFKTLKTATLEHTGDINLTSNANVAVGLPALNYLTKMGIASAPGPGGNAVPFIDVNTNQPLVLNTKEICIGMSGYGDGNNGPGNEYLVVKAFGQPVSGTGSYSYGGTSRPRDIFGDCNFDGDTLRFSDWDAPGGVWGYPDSGPIQKIGETGNVMYIGATTDENDWETGNVVIKMTVLDMSDI